MPIYKPNGVFADCWSSIGQISFFHRDRICYFRTKPAPSFPGTPGQLHQSSLHHRAILAWQGRTSQEQHCWKNHAMQVHSHRPPFKEDEHISGYNLFVSAYHGFAQLENEHIPAPMPYPKFPEGTITSVSASVVSGTDLQLDCKVFLEKCTDPQRFRLTSRIQLAHTSAGCNQSLMRSFLSVTREWTQVHGGYMVTVRFQIPDYRSIWHLDLPNYSLHMRSRLIDSVTGYRGDLIKSKHFINM